jgi:hypothetical protein
MGRHAKGSTNVGDVHGTERGAKGAESPLEGKCASDEPTEDSAAGTSRACVR